jgi:N utilization substance protein B
MNTLKFRRSLVPKSNSFINGILDKILGDLKTENKIKKIGRGLIE